MAQSTLGSAAREIGAILAARGVGVESLLSSLPGLVVVAFALLTQLGDVWFLTAVVTLLYWLGPHTPRLGDAVDRQRGGRLLSVLVLSVVVVAVLKPLLAFPRPPGAAVPPHADLVPEALTGVYEWLSTSESYGFPSGHAFGSTLVYGGLAWTIRVGSRRARAAFAAGMVALLSVSRLVLGLHYLVDVLAGATLGIVVLVVAMALRTRDVFGIAAVVGLVGAVTVEPSTKVLGAAGLASGCLLTWLAVGDSIPSTPSRTSARATVVLGVIVGGVLGVAGLPGRSVAPAVLLLTLAGGASLVAMPLLGEHVAKNGRR
ncbi:phosphatase PAP2 family protein [Halapricum salinum]|uniref:Phosphatase PAP2 family protein n=1 Tax=Halapricum salinum TaxID=1457250 RepID=A0A4D6H9Z1_9EURY|nr:phosphatase PAP2 family protein [Halapricum salinum]QCC50729.1 phosphatase PAP2 family protein [Halapricum salinum]